jgi:DNA-binding PadR family transcriptional regulator
VHKQLLILGTLRQGSAHGYALHRVLRAHGGLYADLKKANLYYLLERLESDGFVVSSVDASSGDERGRKTYSLTRRGHAHFKTLLREVLADYSPPTAAVDVATSLLDELPPDDAVRLLTARREQAVATREQTAHDLRAVSESTVARRLAVDHLLSRIDAEIAWIDRAVTALTELSSSNARGASA